MYNNVRGEQCPTGALGSSNLGFIIMPDGARIENPEVMSALKQDLTKVKVEEKAVRQDVKKYRYFVEFQSEEFFQENPDVEPPAPLDEDGGSKPASKAKAKATTNKQTKKTTRPGITDATSSASGELLLHNPRDVRLNHWIAKCGEDKDLLKLLFQDPSATARFSVSVLEAPPSAEELALECPQAVLKVEMKNEWKDFLKKEKGLLPIVDVRAGLWAGQGDLKERRVFLKTSNSGH